MKNDFYIVRLDTQDATFWDGSCFTDNPARARMMSLHEAKRIERQFDLDGVLVEVQKGSK